MNQTVLLIEDSQDDIVFMRRALAKTGIAHTLQVVRDGTAALAYLRGDDDYGDRVRFPLPSLVLIDLKMPLLTGFEVLSWVRSQPQFAAMTMVVLTSSDHPVDVGRAYALGANSFLSKPGNVDELVVLVHSLADYWLTKNVTSCSPRLRQASANAAEMLTSPGTH